jgi:hypothetical protein
MPPIPPIIEWADITGAASIVTTTAHPIVILQSMTILPIAPRHSENAMQNVQMTIDLISDRCVSLIDRCVSLVRHRGLSNGYEQAAKVLLRDRNKTTHSLLMPTTTINSLCRERQWLTRSVFKLIGQPSQW